MTPEKNSFKLLAEEEAKLYPKAPPRVEQRINGTMGFVRMISHTVELYLPRIFDMMVVLVGGKHDSKESNRRDPAGRQGPSQRG